MSAMKDNVFNWRMLTPTPTEVSGDERSSVSGSHVSSISGSGAASTPEFWDDGWQHEFMTVTTEPNSDLANKKQQGTLGFSRASGFSELEQGPAAHSYDPFARPGGQSGGYPQGGVAGAGIAASGFSRTKECIPLSQSRDAHGFPGSHDHLATTDVNRFWESNSPVPARKDLNLQEVTWNLHHSTPVERRAVLDFSDPLETGMGASDDPYPSTFFSNSAAESVEGSRDQNHQLQAEHEELGKSKVGSKVASGKSNKKNSYGNRFWVAVLCMERAFKKDTGVLRSHLQAHGGFVLLYRLVEQCFEWPKCVPETLRGSRCVLICDIRTKHAAELLAYRNADVENGQGVIDMCVLSLTDRCSNSEHQKAQAWVRKSQPRLPFKLYITTNMWQTIDLISMQVGVANPTVQDPARQCEDARQDTGNASGHEDARQDTRNASGHVHEPRATSETWCNQCGGSIRLSTKTRFCIHCGSQLESILASSAADKAMTSSKTESMAGSGTDNSRPIKELISL